MTDAQHDAINERLARIEQWQRNQEALASRIAVAVERLVKLAEKWDATNERKK